MNNIWQPQHIASVVGDVCQFIRDQYARKGELSGISTGFGDIDIMTGGLQRSDLVIMGARPSMGKSALALNIAEHVAIEQKLPVLFISSELSKEMLIRRLLCIVANIDANKLRTGFLSEGDFVKMESAQAKLSQATLYVDDRCGNTVADIAKKCRWVNQEAGQIGLVVVDNLQMVRSHESPINLAEVAGKLKELAVELNSPMLALSQLPRSVEGRKNKRPVVSDLTWADDADVVAFLYRDDYYTPDSECRGEAEVIFARHKHGPVGTVELLFQAGTSRFLNKDSYFRQNCDVKD